MEVCGKYIAGAVVVLLMLLGALYHTYNAKIAFQTKLALLSAKGGEALSAKGGEAFTEKPRPEPLRGGAPKGSAEKAGKFY